MRHWKQGGKCWWLVIMVTVARSHWERGCYSFSMAIVILFDGVRGLVPPKRNIPVKNKSHVERTANLSCPELCKTCLLKNDFRRVSESTLCPRFSQPKHSHARACKNSKLFFCLNRGSCSFWPWLS